MSVLLVVFSLAFASSFRHTNTLVRQERKLVGHPRIVQQRDTKHIVNKKTHSNQVTMVVY